MSDFQDDINQFSEEEKLDFILNKKPDRTVFTIDVGNLPKGKAEDYIKKIIEKYRK